MITVVLMQFCMLLITEAHLAEISASCHFNFYLQVCKLAAMHKLQEVGFSASCAQ